MTKSLMTKSEQLLRIDDHDFTMRPAFGGRNETESLNYSSDHDYDTPGSAGHMWRRVVVIWFGSNRH